MRRRTPAVLGLAAALASFLLLAGCISLTQTRPPSKQFRLDYVSRPPAGTPLPVILRVPPMEVAAIYDREPIVYREDDYRIEAYNYARWAGNPGTMIAELLARDFAASGLYRDVQMAVSLVPPDYQVKGTLEEIEERGSDSSCTAHLGLRLTLTASRGERDRRVRFTKLYEADEPVRCGDHEAIAAAMSAAMAKISAEVQADVYAELAKPS
jgi:ABC-type uncharacterized transport system auxiliary subunit